jgi:hypothetical protein
MNGDPQATSARMFATHPGGRWSSWITRVKRRRQRDNEERLELVERLAGEERRRRQSGEYFPDLRSARHWY